MIDIDMSSHTSISDIHTNTHSITPARHWTGGLVGGRHKAKRSSGRSIQVHVEPPTLTDPIVCLVNHSLLVVAVTLTITSCAYLDQTLEICVE